MASGHDFDQTERIFCQNSVTKNIRRLKGTYFLGQKLLSSTQSFGALHRKFKVMEILASV